MSSCNDGLSVHGEEGGFTLLELMIAIAIAAIVVVMGAPAFTEMIANQRVKAVTSELLTELAYARAEAAKRRARVGVAMNGVAWENGWSVFVDDDRDNQFGGGDTVLKQRSALSGGLKVCATGVNGDNSIDAVIYGADGRLRTYSSGVLKSGVSGVVISSSSGTSELRARVVVFSATGRLSVEGGSDVTPCV